MSDRPRAWLEWQLIAAIALAALLLVPFLGAGDFVHEEPRRVVIAEEMLTAGHWFVPRLLGEVYTAKPPLYNWLLLPAGLDGDITPAEARLVSLLALAALGIAMGVLTRGLLPLRQRWFAGLGTVLAVECMRKGTLAEIDMVFAALVAIALLAWLRSDLIGRRGIRLWLPPMGLMALAFLTKREPAVVFFYLPVLTLLWWDRRLIELLRSGHVASGCLAALTAAVWLVPIIATRGLGGFLADTRIEVTERGLHADWAEIASNAVSYPFEVWIAAAPFSLLLPLLCFPAVWRAANAAVNADQALYRRRILRFALVAIAVNLPLYMFRGGVSVRYFLPMVPFFVLAASFAFEALARGAGPVAVLRVLGVGLAVVCGIVDVALLAIALQLGGVADLATGLPPALLLAPWAIALLATLGLASSVIAVRNLRNHIATAMLALLTLVSTHYLLVEASVLTPRRMEKIRAHTDVGQLSEVLGRADAVGIAGTPPRPLWTGLPMGVLPYETDSTDSGQPFWVGTPDALAQRGVEGETVASGRVLDQPIIAIRRANTGSTGQPAG